MFAARFDPSSLVVEEENPTSTKRKLSDAEIETDEDSESGSESDSSSGSDGSSSESEGDSSSGSESSSESSDEEDKEIKDSEPEDKMDIDAPSNEPQQPEDQEEYLTQEHDSKFSSIISRFNKSIIKSSAQQNSDCEDEEESTEQHELIPLPQPELPRDQRLSRALTNNSLNWLANPNYIRTDTIKPFNEFPGLSSKILKNLKNLGFENAFATQVKTLDLLLPEINNKLNPNSIKGDLLVNASTGSGKTLAYTIPIIQSLQNRIVPKLKCIILVPTKPLINQVYKTMTSISKGVDLNIVTLGKTDLNLNEESQKLKSNIPDVIISTPGRLVDHLSLKSISLENLQWCIIDEADRLLNQSFQDWSNVLIKNLNQINEGNNISKIFKPNLIKMIFSATLTTDSGKLSNLNFHNPRLIIVNNEESILQSDKIFTLPTTLSEHLIKNSSASSSVKPLLLWKLLQHLDFPSNVLVFTKSNEATLRLSRLLTILTSKLNIVKPVIVGNINSSQSRSEKSKILTQFSQGLIHILISTDLISRGIDIPTIQHVMNYDLPNSSREYVHRVGRTARANQKGDAYNFLIGKGETRFWYKFNLDINRGDHEVDELEIEDLKEGEKDKYVESLGELEKEVFNK